MYSVYVSPHLWVWATLPALIVAVSLSTTSHTCYKNLPKQCSTSAIVQPHCDGAINDVCKQATTAYSGAILYNTTESCTATLNLGESGNFPYDACVAGFQAITIDCMLESGDNYDPKSQGGVTNMVPFNYIDNFVVWEQADTNKPAWQIAASGCA